MRRILFLLVIIMLIICCVVGGLLFAVRGRAEPTPSPTPTATPQPTSSPTATPTPAYLWQMEFVEVYRFPHSEGEQLVLHLILHNQLNANKAFRAADLKLRNAAHKAEFAARNFGESWRVPANGAQEMTWEFIIAPGASGPTTISIQNWEEINLGNWENIPTIIPTPTPSLTPTPTRTPRVTATPEVTPTTAQNNTAWLVSADGTNISIWTDVEQTTERAQFPSGTQVQVLSQHNDFYLVIVGIEQGWVHQSFISFVAP